MEVVCSWPHLLQHQADCGRLALKRTLPEEPPQEPPLDGEGGGHEPIDCLVSTREDPETGCVFTEVNAVRIGITASQVDHLSSMQIAVVILRWHRRCLRVRWVGDSIHLKSQMKAQGL